MRLAGPWSRIVCRKRKIEIDSRQGFPLIRTEYPNTSGTFWNDNHHISRPVWNIRDLPRNVQLDEIKLVTATGTWGSERPRFESPASWPVDRTEAGWTRRALNRKWEAGGECDGCISSGNVVGKRQCHVESLGPKAESGSEHRLRIISNDFGIPVSNHHWVRPTKLRGELAEGPHVRVRDVNGRIDIRHAMTIVP